MNCEKKVRAILIGAGVIVLSAAIFTVEAVMAINAKKQKQ